MDRYTKDMDHSYSLGMSLTIEALLHKPDKVREVVLSAKANKNSQLDLLIDLCDRNHIPYRYDENVIRKLSVKENCYCIGVFEKFETPVRTLRHVLLYGFNDFGELGTILRSAVAFDFEDIILINSDIDIFDPRCIRASMGSVFHIGIARYASLAEYEKAFAGFHIYPFVSDSKRQLEEVEFKEPYGLLISQDPHGLDSLADGICLMKDCKKEISLSIRSSIILEAAYDQKRRR